MQAITKPAYHYNYHYNYSIPVTQFVCDPVCRSWFSSNSAELDTNISAISGGDSNKKTPPPSAGKKKKKEGKAKKKSESPLATMPQLGEA